MFILVFLTTLLVFLTISQYKKYKKFPPGPFPLPILGNIPELAYRVWRSKRMVPALDYYRQRYGNVFTLWIGPFPYVSIADFETAHEVFVKNGKKYKDRLMAPILESSSEGHGLFNTNGEEWEEMRRFTLLAFRSLGVGRDLMEKKTMAELDIRCAAIDAEAVNGKSVVWMSKLFDLTVGSVLNSVLIGKRFDENNTQEYMHVKRISDTGAGTNTLFDTTVSVWLLKKFFPWRYRTTTDARNGIVEFVAKEVEKRYEEVKEGRHSVNWDQPEDLIDAFIAKMEENSVYTLDGLKVLLLDLWQAGQSTTSTTLKAGFNHLASHPEVVHRVRQELLKITDEGSRPLSLKDRPNTPYLNATIAEIQRHASLLNVNYWRITHEKVDINGFQIDAGSIICAQLSCYHTNDTIFENPSDFKPERFLENDKLISQLIPFGIGKRSCVGENVARPQLYLILGNLLLRYRFEILGPLPTVFDSVPYSFNRIPDTSVRMELTRLTAF